MIFLKSFSRGKIKIVSKYGLEESSDIPTSRNRKSLQISPVEVINRKVGEQTSLFQYSRKRTLIFTVNLLWIKCNIICFAFKYIAVLILIILAFDLCIQLLVY